MSKNEIRILPAGGPLGADALGVDLERLSDDEFDVLHRAWLDHDGVLRIPGQFVPPETLLAFSARFGELDSHRSLRPETARSTGQTFHTWLSSRTSSRTARPSAGWGATNPNGTPTCPTTTCRRRPVSARGGAAEQGRRHRLRQHVQGIRGAARATRRRIAGLTCKHDASRNSVGEVRRGFKKVYERRDEVPARVHPIVCTHPETGRKCLYLGRRDLAFIPQLPPAESDALLDELWAHAASDEFTWYQRWRLGDIVVWDNRCTMHRRDALDPSERRLLNRAQVKGARPAAAAAA